LLLVFQPQERSLPKRLEPGSGKARSSIPIVRDPTPASAVPVMDPVADGARALESCPWVWFPEGNPAQNAPAATRFFRRQITLPAGRKITKATFVGTADNSLVLYVNGENAGHSDDSANGWRNPAELDLAPRLRPGPNQLAIAAANARTDNAVNPAGLMGRITVEFEAGPPMTERVDKSWKAAQDTQAGWEEAGFNDAAWPSAKEIVRYGAGPWGRFAGGQLTLSPATADPFFGHGEWPADVDIKQSRVYLELDELSPETAARVTVNNEYAGGFMAKPLRLDVKKHLKRGSNSIRIEPFAPKSARLVVYE
jgi:alpha-L-rhamnosidase